MLQRTSHQPPSGGCVLKRHKTDLSRREQGQPPSGGCVLKPLLLWLWLPKPIQPPSGGCVLKQVKLKQVFRLDGPSRLQAAVC